MSTTTTIKSKTTTKAADPAIVEESSSSEEKKNVRGEIAQSSLTTESENAEVPKKSKAVPSQESCSSGTKATPKHPKTILRYETCHEGCFPLYRAIITAVKPKNWDPDWCEWD